MLLLIDNYDSFSYNLCQLLGQFQPDIKVIRNDDLSVDEIYALNPGKIIISPGPGKPGDAGVCEDLIKAVAGEIPLLGVCLGHQAVCEVYGGTVTYAKVLMHGKTSRAEVVGRHPLFTGMPDCFDVGRYYSLAVAPETLPDELEVLAVADDGEIMAVGHKEKAVYGLQFHPESILTPNGPDIIRNFLRM